ncbi:MAG: hypothetical protein R3F50_00210 [Gammaproteobacteria bacterium]
MQTRALFMLFSSCLISVWANAQTDSAYQAPRTEHGQPDLQGVWGTRFNTLLERPEGLPLVLGPEQAAGFAQAVHQQGGLDGNTDPDIDNFGPPVLAMVKGEYRSSIIVHPENGRLPYNEFGARSAAYGYFEGTGFDHPEQRPGVERCIEAWGSPPMRAFSYQLYHGIVQTPDKIAFFSEENAPLRVIHMDGQGRPDAIRTMEGHSIGRWEGDTLVVETTHYDADIPARATMGRPMLLSGDAHVTERFTRVSDTELFYQYTVDDPVYYSEPWRGEYSLTRDDSGHIYEYSCHEGNYSMTGALRGERVIEVRSELGITD